MNDRRLQPFGNRDEFIMRTFTAGAAKNGDFTGVVENLSGPLEFIVRRSKDKRTKTAAARLY